MGEDDCPEPQPCPPTTLPPLPQAWPTPKTPSEVTDQPSSQMALVAATQSPRLTSGAAPSLDHNDHQAVPHPHPPSQPIARTSSRAARDRFLSWSVNLCTSVGHTLCVAPCLPSSSPVSSAHNRVAPVPPGQSLHPGGLSASCTISTEERGVQDNVLDTLLSTQPPRTVPVPAVVITAIGASPNDNDSPLTRGVTLSFLKRFFRELKDLYPRDSERLPRDIAAYYKNVKKIDSKIDSDKLLAYQKGGAYSITTEDVKNLVILEKTKELRCRYVDIPNLVPAKDVGIPHYFVSHAWRNPFHLLFESVTRHLKSAVDEEVIVWVDIFAVSQYEQDHGMEEDLNRLPDVVAACERGTLLVLDSKAAPLSRSWCLFEIMTTVETKGIEHLCTLVEGLSKIELNMLISTIDITKAECYVKAEERRILQLVEDKYGSDKFNNMLKLLLIFKPLSYTLDIKSLKPRMDHDAQFKFSLLWESLAGQCENADRKCPSMVCIQGSAGTGKSAICAMLCFAEHSGVVHNTMDQCFAHVVHAYHFFKHSDMRRQDGAAVIKSLAYQLAQHFQVLEEYYCKLSPNDVLNAEHDLDKLFKLLLKTPLTTKLPKGECVVLLLDALDEAFPNPNEMLLLKNTGFILLRQFRSLGRHVCLILTSRTNNPRRLAEVLDDWFEGLLFTTPDLLRDSSQMKSWVAAAMVKHCAVTELRANSWLDAALSVGQSSSQGHTMVFLTALKLVLDKGCVNLDKLPDNLDQAYALLMLNILSRPDVKELCSVVIAAKEPLPLSLLKELGLREAVELLVSTGLFLVRDYSVYTLHKSVSDWLEAPQRSRDLHVDPTPGHLKLALHFIARVHGGFMELYAVKYLFAHLVEAECEDVFKKFLKHRQIYEFLAKMFRHQEVYANIRAMATTSCLPIISTRWWLMRTGNEAPSRDLGTSEALKDLPMNIKQYVFPPLYICGVFPKLQDYVCSLAGHSGSVTSVAYTPAGNIIATASSDKTVKLWDADTTQCTATLAGHSGSVRSVAFSPTRNIIATASDDRTVRLWDVDTTQCIATLKGHSGSVRSVAFSPTGNKIATASSDTVKLWDANTTQCTATLIGHSDFVKCVAFSPQRNIFATGSNDRTVKLWDAHTAECTATLAGHSGSVNSVAFSADGYFIATASSDNTVKLWDVHTTQCTATLKGHSSNVWGVAFNPAGRIIASASNDKTVKLWDALTTQCTATLRGHSDDVKSIAFSPQGNIVATASSDNTVKLWDAYFRATPTEHSGPVDSVAFSPAGNIIATASSDKTVKLWDAHTMRCIATLAGHSGSVLSVAFSPQPKIIATSSSDNTIKLWDTGTTHCTTTLVGHSGDVNSVAFSPDGHCIASASSDKTVKLWDPRTTQCTATLAGHCCDVLSIAFSPQGNIVATSSSDNIVKMWDVATTQCTAILTGHSSNVWGVAFSPAGNMIATASSDKTVKLWDAHTTQCTATLTGHSGSVLSVAFSPQTNTIASASSDNTVKLWDTHTRQCAATLTGHSGVVRSVAFSPQGNMIASASDDKSVIIWDADPLTYDI